MDIFNYARKKRDQELESTDQPVSSPTPTPAGSAPGGTMSQADFTKPGPNPRKSGPPAAMLKKQGYKKGGLVRGAGAAIKGVKKAKVV